MDVGQSDIDGFIVGCNILYIKDMRDMMYEERIVRYILIESINHISCWSIQHIMPYQYDGVLTSLLGVGDKFGYGKERYDMILYVRCINSDTHANLATNEMAKSLTFDSVVIPAVLEATSAPTIAFTRTGFDDPKAAVSTEVVISSRVDVVAREVSIESTADDATPEEPISMVISYETTPLAILVTITVEPSGKSVPRDDLIASA